MNILVLDNYDSFVYNLAQALGKLGATPIVRRNDAMTVDDAVTMRPDAVIISPGPGTPSDPRSVGVCGDVIRCLGQAVPTLGVCLGHQAIIHAFGGRIVRARCVMHGKPSLIQHDGAGIFVRVRNPLLGARYHSLVAAKESLPSALGVSAWSLDDGEIMGVRHARYPIEGVQFHPESILTTDGEKILANFLRQARR
jgi:anthranilate synthase component 2